MSIQHHHDSKVLFPLSPELQYLFALPSSRSNVGNEKQDKHASEHARGNTESCGSPPGGTNSGAAMMPPRLKPGGTV